MIPPTPTPAQYKEIMRLYPQIRIPHMKEATYYLMQLCRNDANIPGIIDDFRDCLEKHGDVTSYKMKKFDEILKYFKEDTSLFEKFNEAALPETSKNKNNYPKSFGNWQDDRIYISVDMRSANWSVFCKVSGIPQIKWDDFVAAKFNLHPFISKSKSFRQFVMGNLNPGRQQTFQKEFMINLADKYITAGASEPVCLSADELLFEIKPDLTKNDENYTLPILTNLDYQTKTNYFVMNRTENFGESVLIKYYLDEKGKEFSDRKELFSINGNRYFIHYKTLILNEDIEDRDLYFEPEKGRLAKWIL